MSYVLDIETMGHESSTVVLSAALIHVDFEEEFTYQDLLDKSVFVKFNVREQLNAGRTTSADTLEWWKTQTQEVKEKSLLPSSLDVSVIEGLKILRDEYKKNKKELVWIRGSLDSVAIDSLANAFGQEIIAPWWNYRDVRTAIDLLKETSVRAYCDIPGFDKSVVKKHDPVHDCAFDAMQLKYGV